MDHEKMHFLTDSLTNYAPYLVKEWKHRYFRYNIIKSYCKDIAVNHETFLNLFIKEIQLVEVFVIDQTLTLSKDLNAMNKLWQKLNKDERLDLLHRGHMSDRKAERSIRELYHKSLQLINYFELNSYLIQKIDKKYGKLLSTCHMQPLGSTIMNTDDSMSGLEYKNSMTQFMHRKASIDQLRESTIDLYRRTFRQTHSDITEGELQYVKRKGSHDNTTARLLLGIKVGVACTMVSAI